MAQEPMEMDIPAANQVEDHQDSSFDALTTPKSKRRHNDLPNPNTRESSILKKKSHSASTKRTIENAGKSRRNLLNDFEDCEPSLQVGSESKKFKRDPQFETSTATVTIPQSPNQSPEPTSSNAAPEVLQRQLAEPRAKPKPTKHKMPDIMCMTNLRKTLDELDGIDAMNINSNHFKRRQIAELKYSESKPNLASSRSLPAKKAVRTVSDTSITSIAGTSGSVKSNEEYFEDCPDILLRDANSTFEWGRSFLEVEANWCLVHPIEHFPFAPLKDVFAEWAKTGLAVEVPNLFAEDDGDGNYPYWCGTIVHFAGYLAVIQLQDLNTLGFGEERKKYRIYLPLLGGKVKPLRWAFRTGAVLDPGPVVLGSIKSEPLASKLVEFYFKSETISDAMMLQVENATYNRNSATDSIKPMFAALCPQNANEYRSLDFINFTGDRLHAKFATETEDRNFKPQDFASHHKHRNVVPLMHAPAIGAPLRGTRKRFQSLKPSPDSFPPIPQGLQINVGSTLELLSPSQPNVLVAAKITQVYKHGYFEAETSGRKRSTNFRRIYHISDPHVLPMGFAARYQMPLDEDGIFTGCPPLDLSLLPQRPEHPFQVGDKFEAVSLMAPDYIGPATVVAKCAHLICVRFDGWNCRWMKYQWMDPLEDEVYPCGYCETFSVGWKGDVAMPVF